jgi:short-subunit dehydrogenase
VTPFGGRWQPKDAFVIVTGASSGIGQALCRLLLNRGACVIATARRSDRLEQLKVDCGDAGNRLRIVVGDITDHSLRQRLIDEATEWGGRLDLVVNNAGVGGIGPFVAASPDRLRRIMEVNFFAPAELSRLAFPLLCRGRAPVLCNISSVLGHRAVPDKSEYCASKFALHGWSDSLRAEWKCHGIQVTLVSPSTTQSEFFSSVIETDSGQTSRSIGSWTSERVAHAAFAAVAARRSEAILSLGGKALVYADRLTPPVVDLILAKKSS